MTWTVYDLRIVGYDSLNRNKVERGVLLEIFLEIVESNVFMLFMLFSIGFYHCLLLQVVLSV